MERFFVPFAAIHRSEKWSAERVTRGVAEAD
jgi:hypothetical protein